MIFGKIDERYEATLRLVIGNAEDKRTTLDAIVDTGFLSLPLETIHELGLRYYGSEEGLLGNGSLCNFDIYTGMMIWDGQR